MVQTHNADIIATLVLLKQEVENHTGKPLQLTIAGGGEAHLLAKELGEANIGVILNPVRPFPAIWDARRVLAGPPLTPDSQITTLLTHNVTIGIGIVESWEARNTRLDIGWAAIESGGKISREEAVALGSVNLYKLLGVHVNEMDLVATVGGDLLDSYSQVVAVISPRRSAVDFL